jgi:hypothetical protein
MHPVVRWTLAAISVAALAGAATSLTAGNIVPGTRSGWLTTAIGPDALKPLDCAAITVTALVTGSGANIEGTGSAELILGSSAVNSFNARGGNDCVVGGDGVDALKGGPGTDVCIGGPGIDTFDNDCETKIQ